MTKEKHLHKYLFIVLGDERIGRDSNNKKIIIKVAGYPVFKCVFCTRYLTPKLTLGELTLCWRCEKEMIMKSYNLKEKKPHHRDCRKIKELI